MEWVTTILGGGASVYPPTPHSWGSRLTMGQSNYHNPFLLEREDNTETLDVILGVPMFNLGLRIDVTNESYT